MFLFFLLHWNIRVNHEVEVDLGFCHGCFADRSTIGCTKKPCQNFVEQKTPLLEFNMTLCLISCFYPTPKKKVVRIFRWTVFFFSEKLFCLPPSFGYVNLYIFPRFVRWLSFIEVLFWYPVLWIRSGLLNLNKMPQLILSIFLQDKSILYVSTLDFFNLGMIIWSFCIVWISNACVLCTNKCWYET